MGGVHLSNVEPLLCSQNALLSIGPVRQHLLGHMTVQVPEKSGCVQLDLDLTVDLDLSLEMFSLCKQSWRNYVKIPTGRSCPAFAESVECWVSH